MNCKQGDMAYVRGSSTGIDGCIVRCVRLEILVGRGVPAWEIEPMIPVPGSPDEFYASLIDPILHPIRGDLLDDSEASTQPREVTA